MIRRPAMVLAVLLACVATVTGLTACEPPRTLTATGVKDFEAVPTEATHAPLKVGVEYALDGKLKCVAFDSADRVVARSGQDIPDIDYGATRSALLTPTRVRVRWYMTTHVTNSKVKYVRCTGTLRFWVAAWGPVSGAAQVELATITFR